MQFGASRNNTEANCTCKAGTDGQFNQAAVLTFVVDEEEMALYTFPYINDEMGKQGCAVHIEVL